MPFASKAQMRFLYATNPKVAKEMTKKQEHSKGKKSFKKLPEKKKSRKDELDTSISYFEEK